MYMAIRFRRILDTCSALFMTLSPRSRDETQPGPHQQTPVPPGGFAMSKPGGASPEQLVSLSDRVAVVTGGAQGIGLAGGRPHARGGGAGVPPPPPPGGGGA